ncbi:MAG TPA: L,D-transpeptidase family protein [Pseudonocardiaceae bacterium]|jgi:lipoprotein-anchoring transpeptidase ErfK/SrfK
MTAPAQLKPSGKRTKVVMIVLGVVVAVALVAVVGTVVVHASGTRDQAAPQAKATSHTQQATRQPAAPSAKPAAAPLAVASISPAGGATEVAADAALTVTYTAPLTQAPPTPTLSPAVAGSWARHGATMTFTPSGGWMPFGTETVTVPTAAKPTTIEFTIQDGDQLRLEQLLAELNYLPLYLDPTTPLPRGITSTLAEEATSVDAVRTSPAPGTMQWSWSHVPATLGALWKPGHQTVMDQGAIMAFQSDHHLTMDGIAGPAVWHDLVAAVAARKTASHPYDYLVASKSRPETLTVYRDGKVLYRTLSNTGVPGADTQAGTFPVYSRFASTTMSGTNVDGSKYVDPGIPWVAYFNGGDAVHGFVRPAYGFPQSNGCVELPVSNAKQVWQMDPYGTLVTVL